jgi:hypothetical protein
MSRKQSLLSQRLAIATALALGTSGAALADDSSMSRLGGDSYAYFNSRPAADNTTVAAWRRDHPNGLTSRELQALSSSDLSTFEAQVNPQVFAAAPADPAWRGSHPNGLTERELQALSSSSLALWQVPSRSKTAADQTNVAEGPSKGIFAARSMR